jgi:hypothetical protein
MLQSRSFPSYVAQSGVAWLPTDRQRARTHTPRRRGEYAGDGTGSWTQRRSYSRMAAGQDASSPLVLRQLPSNATRVNAAECTTLISRTVAVGRKCCRRPVEHLADQLKRLNVPGHLFRTRIGFGRATCQICAKRQLATRRNRSGSAIAGCCVVVSHQAPAKSVAHARLPRLPRLTVDAVADPPAAGP